MTLNPGTRSTLSQPRRTLCRGAFKSVANTATFVIRTPLQYGTLPKDMSQNQPIQIVHLQD